jgi:hypothetical protein
LCRLHNNKKKCQKKGGPIGCRLRTKKEGKGKLLCRRHDSFAPVLDDAQQRYLTGACGLVQDVATSESNQQIRNIPAAGVVSVTGSDRFYRDTPNTVKSPGTIPKRSIVDCVNPSLKLNLSCLQTNGPRILPSTRVYLNDGAAV